MKDPRTVGELGKQGVMAACKGFLEMYDNIFSMRTNTGRIRLESDTGKKRYFSSGEKGMADLFSSITLQTDRGKPNGLHLIIWWETKSTDGTQTDDQKKFQAKVEAKGHYYYIVRDVSHMVSVLKRHGAIR